MLRRRQYSFLNTNRQKLSTTLTIDAIEGVGGPTLDINGKIHEGYLHLRVEGIVSTVDTTSKSSFTLNINYRESPAFG